MSLSRLACFFSSNKENKPPSSTSKTTSSKTTSLSSSSSSSRSKILAPRPYLPPSLHSITTTRSTLSHLAHLLSTHSVLYFSHHWSLFTSSERVSIATVLEWECMELERRATEWCLQLQLQLEQQQGSSASWVFDIYEDNDGSKDEENNVERNEETDIEQCENDLVVNVPLMQDTKSTDTKVKKKRGVEELGALVKKGMVLFSPVKKQRIHEDTL